MDETFIKQKLRNQDKNIFDSVFTYYYSGLCAFVYQFVQDRDASEDLVQDFFVSFWTDCPKLDISGSLKSYFFTSVKNRALDYLKHQQVKSQHKDYYLSIQDLTIESFEFAESELMELLDEALKKLQPRCRQIFELNRFNGKTNKEIAELLNISQRTVELQISNALKVLKKELSKL